MKRVLYATVLCAGLVAGCDDGTPDTDSTSTRRDTTTRPDNTARNQRDTKTPLDQANNARDTEITAAVHRAITDDSSMSLNARNIKIITQNGVVTLEGVVDSQAEKDAIEAKAHTAAGVASVNNNLEVRTP